MEVPFVSSGALSRAHYALVRKIESATSIQSANQLLITEIKSRREQFSHAGLSLEQYKESLIILLYCHMTITHDYLPKNAFDFALPHAVGLAEAGHRLEQKRIGYLFCAEVMPPSHELQLMLVNTLRKDLESENIPRICLALDNVIISSNEDLVPAIQSRLHDLLSHISPHVRRRALLAFYALSRRNSELLTRISGTVVRRLEDPSQSVVSAALVVSLSDEAKSSRATRLAVNSLLKKTLADPQGYKPWFLLRILQNLLSLGLTEENIPVVLELVRSSSNPRIRAVLRGAFLLFSEIPVKFLLPSAESETRSPVEYLRPLLTSGNPNDQYMFLACLECVDPAAWSGNSPDIPAVLEAWEVERVMQLLSSSDPLIRRKTLRLLNRIDTKIVASYYSQLVQSIPSNLSVVGKNDHALRMLELLEAKSGQDGEFYAQELISLFVQFEGAPPTGTPVLEAAVESVLLHLRNASTLSRVQIATALLTSALDSESGLPQTLMVIVTALATEYCGMLSLSPVDMLRGLGARLTSCIPSVQDACLLSMLRIAADCDEVPAQIISTVTDLRQASKRHVRQRCEQFLTLIEQKPILSIILKRARSSSLPDFIEALHSQPVQSRLSQPSGNSQELPSVSKLRYEAYDTPSPASKMRSRQASDVRDSPRLEADDSHAGSNLPSVTTGELTVESGKKQLKMMSKAGSPEVHTSLSPLALNQSDDPTSRMDLIAFDPSSVLEGQTTTGTDFERIWKEFEDSYSARGWCDGSVDDVVRAFQEWDPQQVQVIPAEVPPFLGEVKVVIGRPGVPDSAVVRMKGTAEDGSLWRVRSSSGELRTRIKAILVI